jgi:DNA polymerase-3 subunit beta
MKFKIDQETFAGIISRAQSVMERKSTRPILENILITAKEDSLILSATDLRISLTQKAPCTVTEPGSISLAGRKLHEIVRELPKGEISVEDKDGTWVTITGGKSTFHIPGTPAEEYPTIPEPPAKFLKIPAAAFDQMVTRTLFASSNDETRIYLCGVFFKEWVTEKGKPYLKMVATDGHRLSLVDKELGSALNLFENGIIVPKKGVSELKGLLPLVKDEFEIACDEGRLYAKVADVTLSVTLIDASFPNYQQVIPEKVGKGVLVPCEAFRNALRRVSILSDQETRSVVLEIKKSNMTLTSDNPSLGDAKETLDVEYDGEDFKVAFNATYLMDVLKVMEDDYMRMEIRDSLSPALFLGTDRDNEFLSVVMPMRID